MNCRAKSREVQRFERRSLFHVRRAKRRRGRTRAALLVEMMSEQSDSRFRRRCSRNAGGFMLTLKGPELVRRFACLYLARRRFDGKMCSLRSRERRPMRLDATRHVKLRSAFGKLRARDQGFASYASVYVSSERLPRSDLHEDYEVRASGNGRLSRGKWSIIPNETARPLRKRL